MGGEERGEFGEGQKVMVEGGSEKGGGEGRGWEGKEGEGG